jgi:hypothetical protein
MFAFMQSRHPRRPPALETPAMDEWEARLLTLML